MISNSKKWASIVVIGLGIGFMSFLSYSVFSFFDLSTPQIGIVFLLLFFLCVGFGVLLCSIKKTSREKEVSLHDRFQIIEDMLNEIKEERESGK